MLQKLIGNEADKFGSPLVCAVLHLLLFRASNVKILWSTLPHVLT